MAAKPASPLPLTAKPHFPVSRSIASGTGPPMCSRVWRSHPFYRRISGSWPAPRTIKPGSRANQHAIRQRCARPVGYLDRRRQRLPGWRRNCRRRALSHPPSSPRTPPDRGALAPDLAPRRGGRVVECTALEMRHRCKPIGGSNPSLSAISLRRRCRSTTMQALCAPAGLRPSGQHCAYNRNKRRAPFHRLEVRRHVPHSIQGSGPSLLRLTR